MIKAWIATATVALWATGYGYGCSSSTAPLNLDLESDAATSVIGDAEGCFSPSQLCKGECINIEEDPANCGGCGIECALDGQCIEGECKLVCPDGKVTCGPVCADLQRSNRHCGECEHWCEDGTICIGGECKEGCVSGLTMCDYLCVNLEADPTNCGQCGIGCEEDEVCADGLCVPSCPDGLSECGGGCVNVHVDPFNCGECSTMCDQGEVCWIGQCQVSCQEGFNDCNGRCVNVGTDRANCGECGRTCRPGEVCSDGACTLSCQTGLTNCLGSCVNMQTDLYNCGTCGGVCSPGELCSEGKCELSCPTGLTECAGGCANTATDRHNCGGCGKVCGPGMICEASQCVLSCPLGQTPCNGQCISTDRDPNHCGSCDNQCAAGQLCHGSQCTGSCPDGTIQCGSMCANLSADAENCGQCGNACAAGASCTQGSCQSGVSGVALDRSTLTMEIGDTYRLTAIITPSNAQNRAVTWSSSNTRIASVDTTGRVQAVRVGQAMIRVTTVEGGYTASCLVTVVEESTGGDGTASCAQVYNCLVDCDSSNQSCTDACVDSGSPTALFQLDNLLLCMDSSGCGDDLNCIYDHCWDQIATCFPQPTGDLSCGEILDCFDGCAYGAQNCTQNCYWSGTLEGQRLLDAIFNCYEAQCQPGDNACLNSVCRDQIEECFYGPAGTATCGSSYMCMMSCPDESAGEVCIDECYLDASFPARAKLRDMVNCFNQSECEENDTGCIVLECGEEIAACGLLM